MTASERRRLIADISAKLEAVETGIEIATVVTAAPILVAAVAEAPAAVAVAAVSQGRRELVRQVAGRTTQLLSRAKDMVKSGADKAAQTYTKAPNAIRGAFDGFVANINGAAPTPPSANLPAGYQAGYTFGAQAANWLLSQVR